MIKLEIRIETKKDNTYLNTNIKNEKPGKMEQILLNFILSYISSLTSFNENLMKEGKNNEK